MGNGCIKTEIIWAKGTACLSGEEWIPTWRHAWVLALAYFYGLTYITINTYIHFQSFIKSQEETLFTKALLHIVRRFLGTWCLFLSQAKPQTKILGSVPWGTTPPKITCTLCRIDRLWYRFQRPSMHFIESQLNNSSFIPSFIHSTGKLFSLLRSSLSKPGTRKHLISTSFSEEISLWNSTSLIWRWLLGVT